MNRPISSKESKKRLAAASLALASLTAFANPQGGSVVSGSATFTQKGSTLQINTGSKNTVLQWSSFNIAAGETTIFNEPSSMSIVFNKINGLNPSVIFGSLHANGIVVLQNASGFYFGPHALVKTGGFVVTTAAIDPWGAGGGMGWTFDGPPAAAPVVNYGQLATTGGGSIYVIAKQIENHGTISTPGGTTGLLAGQEVLLSERPDGLCLSEPVQAPAGSINNQGRITADAGQLVLQAQTVNNSGTLQANSVREKNGVIELFASQDLQLASASVVQANGDSSSASSPGGTVTLKSAGTFSDAPGSQISAAGGASGGNGGAIEVSAPSVDSLNSKIDAGANVGSSEGLFSLDPENIVLGSSGSTSAGSSGVITATGTSGEVDVNVNTAFQNINANIQLEASGNITLSPGTTWNLSSSTGHTSGQLTLEAGGNIVLGSSSSTSAASIKDANDWSLTLDAGFNVASGQGIVAGTGTVQLYSGSAIQTAAGNVNVLAGNSVLVGSGGIVTGISGNSAMASGGGNINIQAVSGNVDGGSTKAGFNFKSGTLGTVDPALGGISTAAGGNVTIQAGGNITDEPTFSGNEDPGCGAFGSAPGNVTLIAGGNVTGHYVLANGIGSITANNAGTAAANLSLSLVKGAWDVDAVNNIVLQEVRNPNGVFDFTQGPPSPLFYLFNYDPLSSVTLDAGNGVAITGSADAKLPRNSNTEGLIFPPNLTIDAGAGGVTLDANVVLYPSPSGNLNIATSGGGNIVGNNFSIDISDSVRDQYNSTKSFGFSDPDENVFLHLDDPNPAVVSASGSIENFFIDSPKELQMTAAQNIVDCGATVQNLRAGDTTQISAGGQILQYGSSVIVQLQPGDTPNFNALNQASLEFFTLPDGTEVLNPQYNATAALFQYSFNYDPSSHTLVLQGPITAAQAAALAKIGFLNTADLATVQQASQNETDANEVYQVAGPGTFALKAASITLGNEGGIVSQGIAGIPANAQLASITPRGADIDITTSGDLNMIASSIESMYGGNLNIQSGGAVEVGSPLLASPVLQSQVATGEHLGYVYGLITLWRGDINVVAEGNIDVAGSRVAAYDGGNIFLESLQGSVNAGSGGAGSVTVQKPYLSKSGVVLETDDGIPGSGILATSFPQLVPGEISGQVGNITIETPEGDIDASQGGIVQLALGPVGQNNASINLSAGSKNPDGSVAYVGNVNASGSGVVGAQVNISATGNVNGLIIASVGANVTAIENANVTVLSQGNATVSAGGTVSGSIVGVGNVSVSGSSDVAAAFSATSVSASGAVSGAAAPSAPTGSSSASAAATSQQVTQNTQANSNVAANNPDESDDLKKKKKAQLVEYVGRVTVLLPQ